MALRNNEAVEREVRFHVYPPIQLDYRIHEWESVIGPFEHNAHMEPLMYIRESCDQRANSIPLHMFWKKQKRLSLHDFSPEFPELLVMLDIANASDSYSGPRCTYSKITDPCALPCHLVLH